MLKLFREFLIKNNVFVTVIGILLSGEIKSLANSFIDNIIEPIINIDLDGDGEIDGKKLYEKEIQVSGVKFRTGRMMKAFCHFIIILFIVFMISKTTRDIMKK